ncbi:MAG: hypothetical protein WBG70_13055 [Spirulinaceae cyanobacterium]
MKFDFCRVAIAKHILKENRLNQQIKNRNFQSKVSQIKLTNT